MAESTYTGAVQVSTKALDDTVAVIADEAKNIIDASNSISAIADTINGPAWGGTAANKYRESLKGYHAQVAKLSEYVGQLKEALGMVTATYNKTEEVNVSNATAKAKGNSSVPGGDVYG